MRWFCTIINNLYYAFLLGASFGLINTKNHLLLAVTSLPNPGNFNLVFPKESLTIFPFSTFLERYKPILSNFLFSFQKFPFFPRELDPREVNTKFP